MEFTAKVILSFVLMVLIALVVDASPTTTQSPYINDKCLAARGQFPHHVYCNWFYDCWDGDIVEKECPANLAFNPNTDNCDYRTAVDCGNLIFSSDQGSKRAVRDFRCPTQDGTYADRSRGCAAFVVCNGGSPVEFTCGKGTYFNPSNKVCDYPYNVQCNDGSNYPNNSPTTGNFRCPTANGVFPHSDCTKYWSCRSYVASLKYCPNYKLFDARYGNCISEDRAQCSNDDYQSDIYPSNKYPSNNYPSNKYPSNNYPSNKYPSNNYPSNKYPSNNYPSNNYPSDIYPIDNYPSDNYPNVNYDEYEPVPGYSAKISRNPSTI